MNKFAHFSYPWVKFLIKFNIQKEGQTFRVGYLNQVQLKPRFSKSLDLQISSLVGYFKTMSAFPVCALCFYETFRDKRC